MNNEFITLLIHGEYGNAMVKCYYDSTVRDIIQEACMKNNTPSGHYILFTRDRVLEPDICIYGNHEIPGALNYCSYLHKRPNSVEYLIPEEI